MPRHTSDVRRVRDQQIQWAQNKGISVDRRGYVHRFEDNFFAPLTATTVKDLGGGDGKELGSDGEPGKIQALHSSSALVCNVFDYWRGRDTAPLAAAFDHPGRFAEIGLEVKFPTGLGGKAPNLDAVLAHANGQRIAIEGKFLEPYGARKAAPFKESYFRAGSALWTDAGLPRAQSLAEKVRHTPDLFIHLDAQQLLKHLLGIAKESLTPPPGQYSTPAALCYLWYDVGGDVGRAHADEIASFLAAVDDLKIPVTALSYQALFRRLANVAGPDDRSYIEYLAGRYQLAAGI